MKLASTVILFVLLASTGRAAQQVLHEAGRLDPSLNSGILELDISETRVAVSGQTGITNLTGRVHVFDMTSGSIVASQSQGSADGTFGGGLSLRSGACVYRAGTASSSLAKSFSVPSSGGAWTSADPQDANTNFGLSIAIDEPWVLVGAPGATVEGSIRGAAYVLDSQTGLIQRDLTWTTGVGQFSNFGWAVDADEGRVLVGAPSTDQGGDSSGSAYLFDAATGDLISELFAADANAGDSFGYSVGLSGGVAVIGALQDDAAGTNAGAAYLFSVSTGVQLMKLLASDAASDDQFGRDVDISGDLAIIGASGGGKAYIFQVSTGMELYQLAPADGSAGFGERVAIDGDRAVVTGAGGNEVYVYLLPSPGSSGSAYCFGDGSGLSCPCGSEGASGTGCANSSGTGARLVGAGTPWIGSDSFELSVSGAPPGRVGLVLRGSNMLGMGYGTPVGDGLLCTAGAMARSHAQITNGNGAAIFSDWHGQLLGAWSYGAGQAAHYQFWYRDPGGSCTGLDANFSNAWRVSWLP